MAVAVNGSPIAHASSATNPDAAGAIDEYMRSRLPNLHTPGMALVVVEGDQVTFSGGYGLADRETRRLMTDETPVPMLSTNKP